MKYILLAYRDVKWWDALSISERVTFEEACRAGEQELIRSHSLIDIYGLQNSTSLTVRSVHGKVTVTDGPVTVSQEQLIQFLLIEARDLNAAIQIASQMPQARCGPIEVRPFAE